MLVLTCMEQDDTSISEEVEREINDLVERNRAANDVGLNGITIKGRYFCNFDTCTEMELRKVEVWG